mmetsp:Transcript_38929/g.91047  ORF Transcript_38929/g.91047 Transcript_38929/m.91047 type:complete len:148 (+) Transcript_38929:201-644(+)
MCRPAHSPLGSQKSRQQSVEDFEWQIHSYHKWYRQVALTDRREMREECVALHGARSRGSGKQLYERGDKLLLAMHRQTSGLRLQEPLHQLLFGEPPNLTLAHDVLDQFDQLVAFETAHTKSCRLEALLATATLQVAGNGTDALRNRK